MIVYFMCVYYSQWAHENLAPRSQEQWNAFKFCRAVKRRNINGSLTVPLKAGPEMISSQNVERARQIFGSFIRRTCLKQSISNPVFIPVPSKDGLIGAATFRSLEMLRESLGVRNNSTIAPVLRFSQKLQPAFSGGPRGRGALLPYLTVTGAIPNGQIILVDDVLTTGGSLLDSCDVLSNVGRAPTAAIVCGKTVSDSLLSSFGYHEIEVDQSPCLLG